MKKLINHTDTVLAESLDGFATAHADIVTLGPAYEFVRRRSIKPGKVELKYNGAPMELMQPKVLPSAD